MYVRISMISLRTTFYMPSPYGLFQSNPQIKYGTANTVEFYIMQNKNVTLGSRMHFIFPRFINIQHFGTPN